MDCLSGNSNITCTLLPGSPREARAPSCVQTGTESGSGNSSQVSSPAQHSAVQVYNVQYSTGVQSTVYVTEQVYSTVQYKCTVNSVQYRTGVQSTMYSTVQYKCTS